MYESNSESQIDLNFRPKSYFPDIGSGSEGASWPMQTKDAVHSSNTGKRYLPTLEEGEVEIGRITLESTLGDVICVFAKSIGERIHYRVVDQYQGESLGSETTTVTMYPMSLKQFVDFFFSGWSLFDCLDTNCGDDLEDALAFFYCESRYYSDFDAYCRYQVIRHFPLPEDEEGTESDEAFENRHSDVEILAVIGVEKVGVWMNRFKSVYKVKTTKGVASLIPPCEDGIATIRFGSLGIGSGETLKVRITSAIESQLQRYKPELDSQS